MGESLRVFRTALNEDHIQAQRLTGLARPVDLAGDVRNFTVLHQVFTAVGVGAHTESDGRGRPTRQHPHTPMWHQHRGIRGRLAEAALVLLVRLMVSIMTCPISTAISTFGRRSSRINDGNGVQEEQLLITAVGKTWFGNSSSSAGYWRQPASFLRYLTSAKVIAKTTMGVDMVCQLSLNRDLQ